MLFIYPFIIAFILVFMSELGDKTQLIALSFSTKIKTSTILFGVALGSLFSHGIAILFGSFLGNIENETFQSFIKLLTYLSFIIFGLITLKLSNPSTIVSTTKNFKTSLHYIFFIAFSIAIGEFGDKTSLASIGLGIQYPYYKLMLILGAILAMVTSDLIAISFGKILAKKIPESIIQKSSGILFLIFGLWGILTTVFFK